jgi:predicted dinucleotide-binding enzyme
MMKVGILGTGDVGQILAGGFAGIGCDVKVGTRDPESEKARAVQKKLATAATVVTFGEAAAFGDIIVIATLWSGTENALQISGKNNFNGKIVIDATNPLDFSHGMPPRLTHGHTDSGGEQVQRWLPGAKVVKAFNIVGNAHMINPQFPGGPPDMFICGNDPGAKKTVADVLKKFGWPSIDIGNIEGSRLLEPMCILWVLYGAQSNSWNHAFKLLRK